jgi:Catalytic LigB subunit of aromatic ring-opening dioxygenase
VAEIVLAYCSSHAPMMSSARMAAPEEQRNHFFGALEHIREEARAREVEACVILSNEHYTNFFLENFPQICIGLGEKNWGPTEEWLPIDKVWIPGHPGLANHIAEYTLNHGFDPAFSHQLELDHGIMTVYYELDHEMKLPLVPIVQNCAVPPLVPLRRAYEFGKAVGEAIRSYDGLQRVAIIGAGGLSHWIGNPRVGDIDEEFDRWFLDRLERGEVEQLLDMPDSEIELAGNGNHEMRSWVAVAGAVGPARARKLAYEPIHPWITGMGVVQWETRPDRDHTPARAEAQDTRREESRA